jgi:hypothetical protein
LPGTGLVVGLGDLHCFVEAAELVDFPCFAEAAELDFLHLAKVAGLVGLPYLVEAVEHSCFEQVEQY